MNYQKHYDLLCERARTRQLDSYTEKHHIIPKCMGGTDESDNLVALTPEEHYVAHQLLVKIYPSHSGLVWAAMQMTWHSVSKKRINNKLHGWLKRKNQKLAKQRIGKKNGSYGRHWYHHPKTLEKIKCKPEEVPNGFVRGGSPKINNKCIVCDADTGSQKANYCNSCRPKPETKKISNLHELKERYNAGESLRTLAKETEFSHVTLYARFKRLDG